ncbi:hypothetical protein BJY52DRAFT_1232635 [Lactarius psammicola]|nr:hypothetical protein BJY52DRAFT_1232635 [Lactarius psammicola]
MQIFRKVTLMGLDVSSVFARDGIVGYIFVEGTESAAKEAVKGLVTVFRRQPRLVPLEQRKALLMSRNPLSRSIEIGQWVRCLHRLYKDDIGFVYGIDTSRDAGVNVVFVPRIPPKLNKYHIGKRKKTPRPDPRTWSARQVTLEWGAARVKVNTESDDKFIFGGETYRSGLVMKNLPPASLELVGRAPAELAPFVEAQFIRDHPTFRPWLRYFAQDNIKTDQRVRIDSGEHRGLVGYTTYIQDDTATVVIRPQTEGPEMATLVLLRELSLYYKPGDNIKHRWSGSTGLVMTVDEQREILTYMRNGAGVQLSACITTDYHNIDFFTPELRFYTIREGTWVKFHKRNDPLQSRRGVVVNVNDVRTTVRDEHTQELSEFNTRDLEVCSTQAPLLPKTEFAHPLVGRRVQVNRGQFKGFKGIVKDVNTPDVTVELEGLLIASNSPNRIVPLSDVTLLLKETRESTPPPRTRTPPATTPFVRLTPEPEGHANENGRSKYL